MGLFGDNLRSNTFCGCYYSCDLWPPLMQIYLIGSLRNPQVPQVAKALREQGFSVFDDWYGAGEIADDSWRDYEQARGRNYKEALQGLAAQHVFEFDKKHLDEADVVVLLYPAGKSAHLELGYSLGKGKRGFILMPEEPADNRWDVMLLFADGVAYSVEELVGMLRQVRLSKRKERFSVRRWFRQLLHCFSS